MGNAEKPKREWYRRSTWSDADRAEFELRLGRARPHSRAQYLRIQAVHLQETGDTALTRVALALLDRTLAEYPGDRLQLASAHAQRAQCFARLGDFARAVEAFRKALAAEREFPNVQTNAWLDFGWLVVRQRLAEHYAEVAATLEEHNRDSDLQLPVQRYTFHAIRALLAATDGRLEDARLDAVRALEAQKQRHSGLRYHPDLGLVRDVDPAIHKQLVKLAGE